MMPDYFGVWGKGQGNVPFLAKDISSVVFQRSDKEFRYPYGFKQGTVLTITEEVCQFICEFDFEEESFNR